MSGAQDPTDLTASLLRRVHAGDDTAMVDLIRRDLPWVQSLVQRRLGPALRARAETQDVVQEAMVYALRHKPRFVVADTGDFRGLMAAIVENVIRHEHRDQFRQRRDPRREQSPPTEGVIDLDATSPSQAAVRDEEQSWLALAMDLLSPEDQRVLHLRQWRGQGFAEVGAALGIDADVARKRFNRALARLAPLVRRLKQGELRELLTEQGRRSSG